MSLESETPTFLPPSSSDVDIQDHNKRSKISYTREFLLSLAKADSPSTVKLPMEAQLSISCGLQDSTGLLSLPSCIPDSRCQKNMPQSYSLKIPDDVNHQLHRSNEPYRPPCRYKALPPSTGDSNDLLNGDTSGSSVSTNHEKAEPARLRKDTVGVAKEDKWHSRQNTDPKDFSKEFPMSPATRNSNSLQFTSNEINKQLYDSWKPSLIQVAARGNPVQPPILPETTKNCSTRQQQVQDSIANETLNLWQTSVNHTDTSWHLLSMLDNGVHLMESEDYSNFNVGQPVGTGHVMECLNKSRPTSFLSQENCEILKKNHYEVLYEQGIMGSQLSNTPVCVHGSPGRIAISDLSDAHISPPLVEEEKQFISVVDKCESAMVHREGILSLQDVKEAISVSMNQDPSTPDFQIQQELELNSSFSSLDGKSNSSSELCLPDEDSLITFDEPFWMPEVENSDVVDSFMSNGERYPNLADVSSPSSPRVIIEKLVESILNDESSAPDLDDLIAHHGAGLDGFSHFRHAQQYYTQFCSSQLNQGRVQQDRNGFPENSIDSGIYSLFSYPFPSNTISQPFPLSQNELRRFDHEVSQSIYQPQMINPGKLNLCSLCASQSGDPPHFPAPQMPSSCTQKLNSIQGCLGYQDPSYEGFINPNSDFHGDGDINQAVVDSFVDMKLQARLWHPYVGEELTQ